MRGLLDEKFVFKLDTLEPVPYEGDWGIGRFLEGLMRFGWEPVMENGNPRVTVTIAIFR